MTRVWTYMDEFSTLDSSVEEEREEVESRFREWLPGRKLDFRHGVMPHELKNQRPDVYLWDIGGLCYVDHGGHRRMDFSMQILQQVEDHPNTLFVPWTMMTTAYLREALIDLLPELTDQEVEAGGKAPHNVWCPPKAADFKTYEEAGLPDWLRQWLK